MTQWVRIQVAIVDSWGWKAVGFRSSFRPLERGAAAAGRGARLGKANYLAVPPPHTTSITVSTKKQTNENESNVRSVVWVHHKGIFISKSMPWHMIQKIPEWEKPF